MKVISIIELLYQLRVREQWFMKNCIHCSNPIPHTRIGENMFFEQEKVDEWFQNRM